MRTICLVACPAHALLVGQDALRQPCHARRPAAVLVFHSDRGSQYGSGEYHSLLARAGALQSMSARANPYHNAWSESFMGTLKSELGFFRIEFFDLQLALGHLGHLLGD